MKKLSFFAVAVSFLVPYVAFAQGNLGNLALLLQSFGHLVNLTIPILIGIAVVVFFWGLVKYINASGKGHKQGRNMMIAGIGSLFVMVTLYGIIAFVGTSLLGGAAQQGALQPPTVNRLP